MSSPRQREILRAAKKLFFHYGPHKTTMNDIAREAKCAVGSVYLDFPSKEKILETLSLAEYEGVLAAMADRDQSKKKEPFAARFVGVLTRRTRAFFEVARAGAHTPELFHCRISCVKGVRARFDDLERTFFATMFETANRAGECDCGEENFDATAKVVQRCIASVSPPWVFDLPEKEAEKITEEIGELLLVGLISRSKKKR